MELSINGRNLTITQRIENYVQKKTSRLDRYMPNLVKVHVDLSEENTRSAVQRQVAQITIRDDRGTILRAEERSNDLFAAIDAVVDKLYRQINRYQGKRRRKGRGTTSEAMLMGEPLPIEEEFEEETEEMAIVRYKRFPVHPMPAEEAIEQMELLGHDFFIFFNPEDEAINVLYKRHDGNYGLLQPELD
jgi:putative sigma-54 modulation protein